MVIAQYKASIGDFDSAQMQMGRAVQIMREDSEAHMGRSRVPAITFQRGFALGVTSDIH